MISKTSSLIARANDHSGPDSSVTQAQRAFSSPAEAMGKFVYFKKKLLDINSWEKLSPLSHFELYDRNGTPTAKNPAEIGDFIKITLPGSGKSDWVSITDITENENETVLTVRPSFDPTENEPDKATVSHFFTDESTNNFCLEQQNENLNFYVIGLEEKSNTDETSGVIESARNFLTANLGYFLGIQKSQWKIFCRNLLEIEEED